MEVHPDTGPEALVEDASPRDEDIVIVKVGAPPESIWVLQRAGINQLSCGSREAAEEIARSFAHEAQVDVWLDGENCVRLVEGRKPRG
jgi:hypothetical protein